MIFCTLNTSAIGKYSLCVLPLNTRYKDALSNIFPVVEKYGFMRPHQSFIINPAKINAVHDLDILMVDNKIIPIPIKKKKMVKEMIENYICSRFEEVS